MINIILVICCLIIMYIDIKYHKIFNMIAYPLMGIGIVLNLVIFGYPGIVYSALGFITGVCMCFIALKLNASRYGELKLMGVIGILKGYNFTFLVSIISYIIFAFFQLTASVLNGTLKTIILNSKIYIDLIFQHGISIATILEENIKPFLIPYSIVVFISTLIGLIMEKM